MSVFDLFRGFFGVPGGRRRGDGQRDPFFDTMTHDDDDDDDDENGQDFFFGGYEEEGHRDPFDDAMRFGFSFGPSGLRVQEPAIFGDVFREMEEMFDRLGRWEQPSGFGNFGVPSIEAPPAPDGPDRGGAGGSGRSLRDYMLKSPESPPPRRPSEAPPSSSPFPHGSPFHKFSDIWSGGLRRGGEEDVAKEDGDLDSRVSSEGLDQILRPDPARPKIRSFFQSVTVTKVVKPDGTVEERRTVRDGQGNEETTVTRSGPVNDSGPQDQLGPSGPTLSPSSADQRDEGSIFTRYFGGFKGR